jgi:hypothetical protein
MSNLIGAIRSMVSKDPARMVKNINWCLECVEQTILFRHACLGEDPDSSPCMFALPMIRKLNIDVSPPKGGGDFLVTEQDHPLFREVEPLWADKPIECRWMVYCVIMRIIIEEAQGRDVKAAAYGPISCLKSGPKKVLIRLLKPYMHG